MMGLPPFGAYDDRPGTRIVLAERESSHAYCEGVAVALEILHGCGPKYQLYPVISQ